MTVFPEVEKNGEFMVNDEMDNFQVREGSFKV